MTTKELIALKILGIGATILYGYSFLWVSVLHLYGGLYYPINESKLKNDIPFEAMVMAWSLVIVALILFKAKSRSFWKILLQDVGLVIILVPFFAVIFGLFEDNGDQEGMPFIYFGIFILTISAINVNDWLKTKDTNNDQKIE